VVLAGVFVVASAAPAWAHAILENTNPPQSGEVAASPPQLTLTFNENVEVELGAVQLFNCGGSRVTIGSPHHSATSDHVVVTDLPHLENGTYQVFWRVISADSHPVHGGFSFTVGSGGAQSGCATASIGKSDKTVGVLFGIDRVLLYAGLALLIGGGVFLFAMARGTSAARRVRALVWTGWGLTAFATIVGIMLEGPYGEGSGLTDAFKWSVVHDILSTHYGTIARLRILLLLLMLIPLSMMRRGSEQRDPPVATLAIGGVLSILLASTLGLSGHAYTGDWAWLAVPLDTVHVLGMAVWLGGLVALLAGALGGAFSGSLRRTLVTFSRLAFWCVVALILSGFFAAWRQVGFAVRGYTSTSYGNILLVKLAIVVALVCVAAVSRRIVRARQTAPLGAPDSVVAAVDERTTTGLRRSVGVEVMLGIAVLAVTALLVNAQPARSALAPNLFTKDVQAGTGTNAMTVSVIIQPSKVGPNEIHIYTLLPDGRAFPVSNITAQFTQGTNSITANLVKAGPNHWLQNGLFLTPSGKWILQIHVTRGLFTDIAAPPITVPVR
jgi:copper transport protein